MFYVLYIFPTVPSVTPIVSVPTIESSGDNLGASSSSKSFKDESYKKSKLYLFAKLLSFLFRDEVHIALSSQLPKIVKLSLQDFQIFMEEVN